MTSTPTPSSRLITVFALGCGAGSFGFGPLARQLTDSIAHALNAFPGLLARPQHLLHQLARDSILDPNLQEGFDPALQEDAPNPDRIQFILYSSLPADSLVRRMTLEHGSPYALSGRIVVENDTVDLSLNLWDVRTPNLLFCNALFGDLDRLPEMVAYVTATLAVRLEARGADSFEHAHNLTRAAIGTQSLDALKAYANATEAVRRAQLSPQASLRANRLPLQLCTALNADPDFPAPRLMLLELSLQRLKRRDLPYAKSLLEALPRLRDNRLIFDLLAFEAHLTLGDTQHASNLLESLELEHSAQHPQLRKARARLQRVRSS